MHLKLPAHRAGLPGKEAVCFLIAPLIPACKAGLAGCAPGQQRFPAVYPSFFPAFVAGASHLAVRLIISRNGDVCHKKIPAGGEREKDRHIVNREPPFTEAPPVKKGAGS
jgi:hypothetical protein